MIRIPNKRGPRSHVSPLRYPGGKTFLFPFFEKLIKENNLKHITYVEPFAGGAGAALALLLAGKVDKIVINDLDKAIFSFWQSAIFNSEEFAEKIRTTPITVREWRRQRDIYSNPESECFDLGFATFFLNRTNVSGILDGGLIGGLDQSGIYKMTARFNREGLIKRIQRLAIYKDKISVFNRDGISLIKDYLNKKNAFIYLDPPYYDKGASLYLNHYKKEDHEALAKELNKNPNAFWLLTYDNKKQIKSLYPDRETHGFSLNYNAYKSRKGKEILIMSDAFAV